MNSVGGNYNVKSNYQQLAFKGKPNTKDLKKMYQAIDELQFRQYLSNPNIPKLVKQETLMCEMAVKAQKIISESGLSLKDALEKLIKKS